MLYREREEFIMRKLMIQSTVKVADLGRELGVSVDTVRRDLKSMEQKGLIQYVHGGACLPESQLPYQNFKGREIVNSGLKREAAKKAVRLIRPGDVIALNSGTTNTVLAQELPGLSQPMTVITNNLAAVNTLLNCENIHLIAIGGDLDPTEQSTYGSDCEQSFGAYRPDIAFLSINAVNCEDGYTDFRFRETGIIRLLAKSAKRVAAVMDSSKFGKCSKKHILEIPQVDLLITDDSLPDDIRAEYLARGFHFL
jgi:DeoR/GlpR family transcriptional regulator of sugar metabolism